MKSLFIILLAVSIVSCSKDATPDDLPEAKQLLLKQITKNNNLYRSYEYFEDNNIKTINYYSDTGISAGYDIFEYANDNTFRRAYSSNNEIFQTTKYYNISNDISRSDKFDSDNGLTKYRLYHFSDNTCGFVGIEHYDNNDLITNHETFEYSDENCSMTSIKYDSLDEIVAREEWIRDSGNQFSKSTYISFFRAENLGNITEYNYWGGDDNINLDRSFLATYEYNEDNYPISQIRTYLNMEVETYAYTYY